MKTSLGRTGVPAAVAATSRRAAHAVKSKSIRVSIDSSERQASGPAKLGSRRTLVRNGELGGRDVA